MSKKRVLMISSAIYLPGEGGYKRELFLFDLMRENGYEVIFVTTDFNHYAKKKRNIEEFYRLYPDYRNIKFLHVSPYKKNISIKRLYAEKQWAKEVVKWIYKNIDKFDVIYGEMPDIDANIQIRKICDKYNKKFIIDIRDLRPEAYHVLIKNDFLYKLLTYRITKKADRAYACADELVAVSKEYLERGLKTNTRSKRPRVVYLGATLERFFNGVNVYSNNIVKGEEEIWIIYAGTLGSSYDLMTLIKAAGRIEKEGHYHIRFKILGQGPDEFIFHKYVKDNDIHIVDFLGFQPYEKMAAYLCKSDITVNAVKKNASQSIINKVADYFAAGIPMLNSCTCKEQLEMVEMYKVGLNYEPENVKDLISKIHILVENPQLRIECGHNARKLALEKFDRRKTHLDILKLIDEI